MFWKFRGEGNCPVNPHGCGPAFSSDLVGTKILLIFERILFNREGLCYFLIKNINLCPPSSRFYAGLAADLFQRTAEFWQIRKRCLSFLPAVPAKVFKFACLLSPTCFFKGNVSSTFAESSSCAWAHRYQCIVLIDFVTNTFWDLTVKRAQTSEVNWNAKCLHRL